MGVVSFRELGRKNEYEIGKPRKLIREFVCVLSDDTLTGNPTAENVVAAAVGIDFGVAHPTYANNKCRKITITEGYEGSPYHVHVLAEYGIILASELIHPTSRPAVWEVDSAPGEVPALSYYDGGTRRPLTNSAYDYFPGLVAQEGLAVAKVTQNFAMFPSSWTAAQNSVNSATYFGCAQHTMKVDKVRVIQSHEEFGGSVVAFWQATAELAFRESGHNLQLPDIGFNFISGGQKRRAMVFDFDNNEWVASANPVGLNGSGGLANGAPAILNRRICPEANFTALFGAPPTTPLPV